MVINATANAELLPGYVAIERLGAGGYGEVWKVQAPGGMYKAIKIVYGFLTEERAARELKALHHVKEVRHPFLLSLERFEIVDGRLMIVTELADMSLMDRFEQCRQANLPGIPRDELINYLRDAAEALDFMLQTHSLQHLDVKPENLLLTAGRTKVADFGLVKEIADKTRSLVGAMTPTYAAPEIFDGKATRQSDQYSLAVLYQEMLTGVLPFPGRTAAQLAAQHTRSRPQLSALPSGDREAVARALSKRAEDRFSSCHEFVDALCGTQRSPVPHGGGSAPQAAGRSEADTTAMHADDTRPSAPPADPCTEVIRPGEIKLPSTLKQRGSSRRHSTIQEERAVVSVRATSVDLPLPENMPPATPSLRPAMFIGVGGTGALVIEKLRGRLLERFGEETVAEGFPMLIVDTDSAPLKHASRRGHDHQNIAHIPLRQAHEYRADSEQLLQWLGRRWLYNVPKSGQTQGMRPWGRLALIDNAATVVSKLRPRLAALANGSVGETLRQAAPDELRTTPPRVYIVGSCCGGTGGGTLMEMAYAVRNIARRFPGFELEVCAIAASSSPQCATQGQLAAANAAAFLTELQHYARCGAQGDAVGDARSALFEGSDFPLDDVYFVHLGDELTPEAFDDQVTALADYIYCDTATSLGPALDHCRQRQAEADLHNDLALRSFRLARFDGLGGRVVPDLGAYLAHEVARYWLSDASGSGRPACASASLTDGELSEFALRSLSKCQAMAWLLAREPQLAPATSPERPEREQLPTWVRGQLLQQLQLLQRQFTAMEPSADLNALLARVAEQERQSRITAHVQLLAERVLHTYARQLYSVAPARPGAAVPALIPLLAEEAQKQALGLVQEFVPDAEFSPEGLIRTSPLPALTYLEQRSQAKFPFGCGRRTFLLSPPEWLTPATAAKVAEARGHHLVGSEAHTFVCEELQDVSLGQIVQSLLQRHAEAAAACEHLHARVDIDWSEPALPVEEGSPEAAAVVTAPST